MPKSTFVVRALSSALDTHMTTLMLEAMPLDNAPAEAPHITPDPAKGHAPQAGDSVDGSGGRCRRVLPVRGGKPPPRLLVPPCIACSAHVGHLCSAGALCSPTAAVGP